MEVHTYAAGLTVSEALKRGSMGLRGGHWPEFLLWDHPSNEERPLGLHDYSVISHHKELQQAFMMSSDRSTSGNSPLGFKMQASSAFQWLSD